MHAFVRDAKQARYDNSQLVPIIVWIRCTSAWLCAQLLICLIEFCRFVFVHLSKYFVYFVFCHSFVRSFVCCLVRNSECTRTCLAINKRVDDVQGFLAIYTTILTFFHRQTSSSSFFLSILFIFVPSIVCLDLILCTWTFSARKKEKKREKCEKSSVRNLTRKWKVKIRVRHAV